MSTRTLKIDFVSDVVCPWCAIGLASLQQAAQRVAPDIALELTFQPFELNPDMAPEGEDIIEHLQRKYGSTPEQLASAQENIRQRGQALGFTFNTLARTRTYNTFDAHRLLHWAEMEGRQLALKEALLKAYFTEGQNPSDHAVLVALAASVGLDAQRARDILQSDEFASEVRAQERFYQQHGIRSVPAIIINQQHLISGGQPPEVFEQALRQIAQQG
jgi:predicted DsbA family dithiol-disulfide isomerase